MALHLPLAASLPSLGQPWDFIVASSLVVTSLTVLWKYVLNPARKGLNQIDQYGPVLQDIAKNFNGNGGSTLPDIVKDLQRDSKTQLAALRRIERLLAVRERPPDPDDALRSEDELIARRRKR